MPSLRYEDKEVRITDEVVIGRHRGCGLQIGCGGASRRHARVFRADEAWWVEDLGSANGTRINGENLASRRQLQVGDVIGIGTGQIYFEEAVEEPVASTAPAAALLRRN